MTPLPLNSQRDVLDDEGDRWADCDALASNDPIAALLCRTSKMNDGMHALTRQLDSGFGYVSAEIADLRGRDERLELMVGQAKRLVTWMSVAGLLTTTAFKLLEDWPKLLQVGNDVLILWRGV